VSPDRYNPKFEFGSTINSASKWRFGSEARNSMENKGNKCVPGAGTYKIPSKVGEGPKYIIGAKIKSDLSPMKNNPGPGTYNIQSVDNLNMQNS
jgi:hypothetical protein